MTKINFEIEKADLIDSTPSSQFATAKLRLFSSGDNKHNMVCSEETLKRTSTSAYEKPIIFEIRYGGDFGTHSDKTVPAGFLVKDSGEFLREPDGRLGFYVMGKIWRMYSGKFLDVFKKKGKKDAKVSVEMELIDFDEDSREMKDFEYTAACILGEMVQEASPGASIQMLSFAYEEAYKNEFERYKNIDFSIPQNIRDNAVSAIKLQKDGEGDATASALSMGKYLINNSVASPEKIRATHKYLSKNGKNSHKYLSCLLYGGTEALEWSKNIIEQMDKEDIEIGEQGKEEKVDGLEQEQVQMEAPEEEKVVEEMSEEEKPEEEKPEGDEAEDKEETTEEDEEEGDKEEMSLDANLDVAAMLAMLENETEDYEELVEGHKAGKTDFAKLCNGMYIKMCKMQAQMTEMEEKNKAYMSENESLRAFKARYEEREFNFAVERVLNEVSNVMPSDKIREQREDAQNFDLNSLSAWENKTKAIAFSYAKDVKKADGITRVGLPFAEADTKNSGSIWKR